MPSVAERIYLALHDRLLDIRGGAFNHDLQGRVHLARPSYDLTASDYPAVFFAMRQGGFGTVRGPGTAQHTTTTLTFDAVGIARASDGGSHCRAGLRLLADLRRALEVPDDMYLRTEIDGTPKQLLGDELLIVDAEWEPAPPGFDFDIVGVGIACSYPHKYGDPDHVS